jgi:hypothetical protein
MDARRPYVRAADLAFRAFSARVSSQLSHLRECPVQEPSSRIPAARAFLTISYMDQQRRLRKMAQAISAAAYRRSASLTGGPTGSTNFFYSLFTAVFRLFPDSPGRPDVLQRNYVWLPALLSKVELVVAL